MTIAPQPHPHMLALAQLLEGTDARQHHSYVRWLQQLGLPATLLEIGGGVATYTGAHSPLNQAVGIGLLPLANEALLAVQLRDYFHHLGVAAAIELTNLTSPTLAAELAKQGYYPVEYSSILGIPLQKVQLAPPATTPGYTIAPYTQPNEQVLEAILQGFGFEVNEENLSFQRNWYAAPDYRQWVAWYEGRPVAGANLYCGERAVLLSGASTLPAYRQRGLQTALIATRLHHAQAQGYEWATVATEPGSVSEANMLRLGFERLYARTKWVCPLP